MKVKYPSHCASKDEWLPLEISFSTFLLLGTEVEPNLNVDLLRKIAKTCKSVTKLGLRLIASKPRQSNQR